MGLFTRSETAAADGDDAADAAHFTDDAADDDADDAEDDADADDDAVDAAAAAVAPI